MTSYRAHLVGAIVAAAFLTLSACQQPGNAVSHYCPTYPADNGWIALGVTDTVTTPASCTIGLDSAGENLRFVQNLYAPVGIGQAGVPITAQVYNVLSFAFPVLEGQAQGFWSPLNGSYDIGPTSGSYLAGAAGFGWSMPFDSGTVLAPTTSGTYPFVHGWAQLFYALNLSGRVVHTPSNVFVNTVVTGSVSANVTKFPSPTFQWLVDGHAVPGATGANYTTSWTSAGSHTLGATITPHPTGTPQTFSNVITVQPTGHK